MASKRRKKWAIISVTNGLVAFGNGHERQYPIFSTRQAAADWKKRVPTWRTRIVPCYVSLK